MSMETVKLDQAQVRPSEGVTPLHANNEVANLNSETRDSKLEIVSVPNMTLNASSRQSRFPASILYLSRELYSIFLPESPLRTSGELYRPLTAMLVLTSIMVHFGFLEVCPLVRGQRCTTLSDVCQYSLRDALNALGQ